MAQNFCKTYGLKQEIADRLAKTIAELMGMYLREDSKKDENETELFDEI